jgi:uncharacterized protein
LAARDQLAAGPTEVVIGPSLDGGYYLLGLKAPHPELFAGISWATDAVLADTLKRARELSLTVELLPYWRDIDTYADLLAFLQQPHPPLRPGWRSDRTAGELLGTAGVALPNKIAGSAHA